MTVAMSVFNANMATVGNFAIAKKLLARGMFATIHKHYNIICIICQQKNEPRRQVSKPVSTADKQ